mmetsp:Transcript_51033/g.128798  ORF Transcript_51033/g.128798 Transcript_51033/m.128798 type:complete len:297 (+) Transcript_51033:308-1198(+)
MPQVPLRWRIPRQKQWRGSSPQSSKWRASQRSELQLVNPGLRLLRRLASGAAAGLQQCHVGTLRLRHRGRRGRFRGPVEPLGHTREGTAERSDEQRDHGASRLVQARSRGIEEHTIVQGNSNGCPEAPKCHKRCLTTALVLLTSSLAYECMLCRSAQMVANAASQSSEKHRLIRIHEHCVRPTEDVPEAVENMACDEHVPNTQVRHHHSQQHREDQAHCMDNCTRENHVLQTNPQQGSVGNMRGQHPNVVEHEECVDASNEEEDRVPDYHRKTTQVIAEGTPQVLFRTRWGRRVPT